MGLGKTIEMIALILANPSPKTEEKAGKDTQISAITGLFKTNATLGN